MRTLTLPINLNAIQAELCRRDFYEYCRYLYPDAYTETRPHLKTICDTLGRFYRDELLRPDGRPYTRLAISIPPRMFKSRTLELFSTWVFGLNPVEKIISICYNETLSISFSKSVRDKISTEKITEGFRTVSDIFPDLKIKSGSGAAHYWSLEGQHSSYLGGSPKGTLTGIGASLLIIDDMIKSAIEALDEKILDDHWQFYTNTLRQRLEEGHRQIVSFTRWATGDLIGRLLKDSPEEWYVLEMEAMLADGSMLCDELLSRESYYDIKKNMAKEIFAANYHQQPIDIEGRLYKALKTYTELPAGAVVKSYTDTADEGNCYLCSIVYGEFKDEAYIIDVLYTGAGMEVTEMQTAEMHARNNVTVARIESNNGGKGFARNVDRLLREHLKTNRTTVRWFHQSQNKIARILANSAWVQDHVYFPAGWDNLWPEFHKDLTRFTKDGKGQKSDAPDALTGVTESTVKIFRPAKFNFR